MLAIAGAILLVIFVLVNLESIVLLAAFATLAAFAVAAVYAGYCMLTSIGVPDSFFVYALAFCVCGFVIGGPIFALVRAVYLWRVRKHEREVTVRLVRSAPRQSSPMHNL